MVDEIKDTCPICFSEVSNNMKIELTCGHLFCKSCAAKLNKCALCRAYIKCRPKEYYYTGIVYPTFTWHDAPGHQPR